MNDRLSDPLFGVPPERVQLSAAPLVRVLAQVQFPPVLKINDQDHIADFQEELRRKYPFLQKEVGQAMNVQINNGQVSVNPSEEVIWRFFDQERNWRISLALRSVSIEVRQYTSRFDFLDRLEEVIESLAQTISPGPAVRVGFRYVNRLTGAEQMRSLDKFIYPDLMGILCEEALSSHVEHCLSEANCTTKDGRLYARWGKMQPNMTHDPGMAEPISQQSWMLDIDSFKAAQEGRETLVPGGFDSSELRTLTENLANRAYAFFRWSVRPAFLDHFGGQS